MSEEYNDLQITKGQKFSLTVSVKDEDGVVFPLAGMKARMLIAYDDYDGATALTLTTENGGIEIVNDKLKITAKTAQTTTLKGGAKAVYEIELIDSENEVIGWMRGDIEILKGIV